MATKIKKKRFFLEEVINISKQFNYDATAIQEHFQELLCCCCYFCCCFCCCSAQRSPVTVGWACKKTSHNQLINQSTIVVVVVVVVVVALASWSSGRHMALGSGGPGFESWLCQVDVESLRKALYRYFLTPLMCKTSTRHIGSTLE